MAGIDLGSLFARVRVDTGDAEKQLDGFSSKVKDLGGKFERVGKTMLPISAGITAIGTASVMAGASVQEMQSKFVAVFGDLSDEAYKWADEYADAIGRSKYEIQEAISNQADLYTGMGFTKEAALELSQQATELAYNLASFNNVQDSRAIEAVTKAMLGETDSMTLLGVKLTDSVMEQSEFVKASGKSWSAMNQMERANAYLNEAIKQSTNAMREENGVVGDARLTAESFTNQLKNMKGKFHEISVAIGQALLPVIAPLVTKFNELLEKVLNFVEANPKIVGVITSIAGAIALISPLALGIGKILTLIGGLGVTLSSIIPLLVALGVGFMAVVGSSDALSGSLSGFLDNVVQYFVQGINTLIEYLPKFIEIGFNLITNIINGIATGIPEFIGTVTESMVTGLQVILDHLPEWLEKGKAIVMQLVNGLVEKVPEWASSLLDGIVRLLQILGENLPEFLRKGADIVVQLISGLASMLPDLLGKMGEMLGNLLLKISEKFPDLLKAGVDLVLNLIDGIIEKFPDMLSAGGELITSLISGIGNFFGNLKDVGKQIVDNIWEGIKGAWSSITSWIGEKLDALNPFSRAIEIDDEGLDSYGVEPIGVTPRSPLGDLFSNPSMFGVNKRRTFDTSKGLGNTLSNALNNVLDKSEEIVLNSTINLDGYTIAKASARYMRGELETIDRRNIRLGGVF